MVNCLTDYPVNWLTMVRGPTCSLLRSFFMSFSCVWISSFFSERVFCISSRERDLLKYPPVREPFELTWSPSSVTQSRPATLNFELNYAFSRLRELKTSSERNHATWKNCNFGAL